MADTAVEGDAGAAKEGNERPSANLRRKDIGTPETAPLKGDGTEKEGAASEESKAPAGEFDEESLTEKTVTNGAELPKRSTPATAAGAVVVEAVAVSAVVVATNAGSDSSTRKADTPGDDGELVLELKSDTETPKTETESTLTTMDGEEANGPSPREAAAEIVAPFAALAATGATGASEHVCMVDPKISVTALFPFTSKNQKMLSFDAFNQISVCGVSPSGWCGSVHICE